MSEWRLVVGSGTPGADAIHAGGARNMAADHVLFDAAKRGGPPTLRFYRWTPACLSLGRNQPARGRYDGGGTVPGRDVVRRPTGGLAVYHDQELTYSVTCRVGLIGSPRDTYLAVHRAIAQGLAALGVPTEIAPLDARAPDPNDPLGVCFAAPAHGEILAAAGKVVGSAQRHEERTILQHGSILIDGTQDRAAARDATRERGSTAGAPSRDAAKGGQGPTLRALLGRTPTDAELIDSLCASFEVGIGIRLAPGSLSADEIRRLPDAEAHYGSAAWTWRT